MKLSAGTMVNPRVRLIEPLGRGAMGSVWRGEHLTLETEVAVKFIKPELSDDQSGGLLDRFQREAKAAAKIKSPHVVQTLDHGFMEDDTPYIVMELLEGETLGERLERVGRIRLKEIAEIVAQVCRGLTKAHELGIVHRDIKPDNLFLIGEGEELLVKILDFGVAKQVQLPEGAATATGTLVGTPQYMSPEQLLRSEDLGPQADLWALSVVAYQAILGRPPFEGETLAGIIVAITQAKFPRPSSIDERLAGPMDRWVDRALALEPEARFGTAKALADSLRKAVAAVQTADPSLTTVDGEMPKPADRLEPGEGMSSEFAETAEFISEAALDVVSDAAKPADEAGEAEDVPQETEPDDEPSERSPERPESSGVEAATSGSIEARTLASPESAPPARESSANRYALIAVGLVAVGVAIWLLRADSSDPPPSPTAERTATTSPAVASGSVAATPSVATTSAAAGNEALELAAVAGRLKGRTVPAGRTPDGAIWLPEFRLVQEANDRNATYLDAHARCRKRTMALCSEAQWQRACREDSTVALPPTWTATAVSDEGFVVRGGDGTCDARQIVAPADASPKRAGVCCSRVVGIRSDNRNTAFLESTATKLGRIEKAFTTGNKALLSALVDERVTYGGKVMLRQPFVERASVMFRIKPAGWLLHDVCDVALFDEDGKKAWSADCASVAQQGTKLGHWMRRYVYDSSTGKLRSIDVPEIYRPASRP
jgi:serine/threonine-protein kinase